MNRPIKPKTKPNDPTKAGQKASRIVTFGELSRYAIYAVHTRFDNVQWFVADSSREDPKTGLPEIVSQSDSFDEAVDRYYQ